MPLAALIVALLWGIVAVVVAIAIAVNVGETGLLNENNLITTLLLIAVALPRARTLRAQGDHTPGPSRT